MHFINIKFYYYANYILFYLDNPYSYFFRKYYLIKMTPRTYQWFLLVISADILPSIEATLVIE